MEDIKQKVLSEHFRIDVEDIEQINDDTYYCLTEGKYCIVNERESDHILTSIIDDIIQSEKDQIKYDLKRSNLEYIEKYIDVEAYYDDISYGWDLTDFDWELIVDYEFGLFYIKRL